MNDEAVIGAVCLLSLLLSMACLDVQNALIISGFTTLLPAYTTSND